MTWARSFNDAATEYLQHAAALVTAVPLSISAWGFTDDTTARQTLAAVGSSTNNKNSFALLFEADYAGDPVSALTYSNAGATLARTSTGVSASTWHHGLAVFAGVADRRVYIDGGSKGTDNGSQTPSGLDRTNIAIHTYGSRAYHMSGRVFEVAMWRAILSDLEAWLLHYGVPPWRIRPGDLMGAWLVTGQHNDRDYYRGYHMTAYNTPTWDYAPERIVKMRQIEASWAQTAGRRVTWHSRYPGSLAPLPKGGVLDVRIPRHPAQYNTLAIY